MAYKIGDKFVIEIDSVMTNKNGTLYGIKGFKSLVFDEYGLEQLERIPGKNVGDMISRQAVKYLDLFAKTYCRDYSVTDDLVFRCKECEYEMPDGKCLVKCMVSRLCPDYREFGSMGDL